MAKSVPILTVNTGSSSIRLAAYAAMTEEGVELLATQHGEPNHRNPAEHVRQFLRDHGLADFALVAHRVVHGGEKFLQSCLLDDGAEREIERLTPLAPLHNPLALRWMRACRAVLGPSVPQVAVFDTAYYAALPEVARTYALPRDLAAKHYIRRYGFHGLAHAAMGQRWRPLRSMNGGTDRVISLQLGAGCSIIATEHGAVRDTSMGFSPLEGLVMATRCGEVDAGLVIHLQRQAGLSPAATDRLLNESSGLLCLSGISGDMRVLLALENPHARLAVDLYCYRARKYIGAYLAVLGGADAILFGGGVGENAPEIRARILDGLEWAGIRLDAVENSATQGTENRISDSNSHAAVWVISVDEAPVMVQEAMAVMARTGGVP
ncbi:MAG TPA: acetate/propionate family kinase [Sulfuricaulis sp.]|nr:acetate/propionate family kinase [Sulfuricaulis sp.]